MANRATLRGYVLRDVQDPTATYLTTSDANALLDEGSVQFCVLTRILRATMTTDLAAGDAMPDLSSASPAILEILKVWLDNRELDAVTESWLGANYSNWVTDQGTPRRYIRFDAGLPTIRLHPAPGDAFSASVSGGVVATSPYGVVTNINNLGAAQATSQYGAVVNPRYLTGGLRIDYVAAHTPMTQDSHSPAFDPQFHLAPYYYAVWKFHSQLDSPISQPQKAEQYMGLWMAEVEKASNIVKAGFQRMPAGSRRDRRWELF